MENLNKRYIAGAVLLVSFATLIRCWHIGEGALNYNYVKQTQAMLLMEAIRGQGVTAILNPRVAWSPDTPFFWQIPIYHLIVLFLKKIFHIDSIAITARAVSIFCSVLSVFPLYRIVRCLFNDKRTALWSCLLFLFLPLSILLGQCIMDDALWVFLGLTTIAVFITPLDAKERGIFWNAMGALLWVLSIMIRPYSILLALPIAGCIVKNQKPFKSALKTIIAIWMIGGITVALWLWHMHAVNAIWTANQLYPNDTYIPAGFIQKFFGPLYSLGGRSFLITGLHQFFECFCSLWLLPFVIIGGISIIINSRLAWWFFAAFAIYFIAFFKTFVDGHYYYFYALSPGLAAAVGAGIVTVCAWIEKRRILPGKALFLLPFAAAAIVVVSCWTGLSKLSAYVPKGRQVFVQNLQAQRIGDDLREFCPADAFLVITTPESHHSYPCLFYVAQRKGWNIQSQHLTAKAIERAKERGAKYWAVSPGTGELPQTVKDLTRDYGRIAHTKNVDIYDLQRSSRSHGAIPRWLPFYFIRHIDEAERHTLAKHPTMAVEQTGVKAQGELRPVIRTQPHGRDETFIRYQFQELPVRTTLRAAIAMHDMAWQAPNNSDGVNAFLRVETADRTILNITIQLNPRDRVEDRGWQELSYDLPAIRGESVTFTFGCGPGPANNGAWDIAGWADLTLAHFE